MTDNTVIPLGTGGDTIRDLARQAGTVKTQVMQLDIGGASANAEVLVTAGQQAMAASLPVAIASDQGTLNTALTDLYITGQGSQLALNQNVLLATAGAGSTDATGYRAIYMHFVTGAGTVTAGIVRFEGSNDNVNWVLIQAVNVVNLTPEAGQGSAQVSISASMNTVLVMPILTRYIRARISTGLTGTTTGVQCFSLLKASAPGFIPLQTGLQIASLPTLALVTTVSTVTSVTTANTLPKATTISGATLTSAATTNATIVKSGNGQLFTVSASNTGAAVAYLKLFNKATAPVPGTDVPQLTFAIPPGDGFVKEFGAQGQVFGNGIGFTITNLPADNDTTAVAAAQVKVMVGYI